MAVMTADSSSTLLHPPSARPVHQKHKRDSQIAQLKRTGVGMQYTILRDPPWSDELLGLGGSGAPAPAQKTTTTTTTAAAAIPASASASAPAPAHSHLPTFQVRRNRASTASSTYSDDLPDMSLSHAAVPEPLSFTKHDPYHAHPDQRLADHGPHMRHSRLPIFKQVRHMLHKPPTLSTPANNNTVKWDEYSGELSEHGRAPQVKPSSYVSPFDGLLRVGKNRLPGERPRKAARRDDQPDLSPVSVLNDRDLIMHSPEDYRQDISPVSPMSDTSSFDNEPARPIMISTRAGHATPPYLTPPMSAPVRRKPVNTLTPIPSASQSETQSHPRTPADHDHDHSEDGDMHGSKSRFSWTTYAASTPGRPSLSTITPPMPQSGFDEPPPNSRFSWTTVNTRPVTSPDSTPPPILKKKPSSPDFPPVETARGLPVQSILSRSRPVQRIEQADWAPPANVTKISPRPATVKTGLPTPIEDDSPLPNGSKKLPLPPELASPTSQLTHLESLFAQERDLQHQRINTLKAIQDLEKLEKASPLDVPFATVRDAKRRLEEHRLRLSEIERDFRGVGIAISRLRRKEGGEQGLWVRRVTG